MPPKGRTIANNTLSLFGLEPAAAAPGETCNPLEQNENLYRAILSSILDSVIILDWNGFALFANKSALEMVGLDAGTNLVGTNALDFIHPEDVPSVVNDLKLVKAGCEGFLAEYRIRQVNGWRWVEGLGRKVIIDGRDLDIVILRDITERKEAQKMLLASEEKFRRLAETTPAAIFIYQGDKIIYCNQGLQALTGYSGNEIRGLKSWDLIHPEMRQVVRERALNRQKGMEAPSRYEVKIITKPGEEKWVDLSVGMIDLDGIPSGMGTAHDITDRKQAEETITRLAYYDPLTGLPNRLLFNDRLCVAITRAERFQEKIAVVMLDLDKFKDINDTLGHTVGDNLLKAVADRLILKFRKSDTVSRMGGDEFIICISDMKEQVDPRQIAEKLLQCFAGPFAFDGREISIKASIGIAAYPDDGANVEMLVRNADIAMYKAKHAGGNRYRTYSEQ